MWQSLFVLSNNYLRSRGGLVVSMLAFYSNHLSSNPGELYSFFFKKLFEKNENKQTKRQF